MNISDALAELGHLLGLGSVALNEEGAARIVFDGDLDVDFVQSEDNPTLLHLDGMVCQVDESVAPAFLKQLLHAHFLGQGTGGASFSLHPGGAEIHLGRALDMSGREFSDFSNEVETFVNYLEAWRKMVSAGDIGLGGITPASP
ncbi:MAG: type III secretion system chaperone [Verrucomicrobium sp.]